ncbi:MAG: sodium/solute symporter [Verrucomicrobia bacterium]|jgi:SSS family solute:Na+ symporter|nr:sodium/solute symporter [Verrucomicrobiota bacterium]
MKNTGMTQLDWAIIVAYLLGVVGIGVLAGFRRSKSTEGGHYFLADNTLTWPIIGLAMFAANISTVHLVSLAQSAYTSGLLYGNYEWMAGFTLILLSLFFAPLYLRTRVPTLPDYLERRYNRNCRDALSIVSLISAIVIHIGVALFTAAAVLCFIFGIPETKTILGLNAMMLFIIALGVLTGIYTVIGGLLAVVWTESIQTVLLLVGAVCITAVGYHAVGGWDALSSLLATQPHPLLGKEGGPELSTRTFLHMMHSGGDNTVIANVPWYSILLGYPVIGIWYWCCDQTIVQRVLAAKDEKHARLGPLFCAFIKILPVFLFVLPGVICVGLVQKGYFGTETVAGVTRAVGPVASKDTYAFMITHLLPIGMKGLVVAAMLAAAMQTCSAALNSAATLFSYDIWKRWKPQTADHSLVKIGRWTTIVATLLAIVLSPIFGHYDTIFKGLNVLICYIAPPITAVFLVGVFWKKAGGRAAFITMVAGGLIGALCFFLDFFKATVVGAGATPESIAASPALNCIYNVALKDFMLASFGIFCLCVIIQVIASLVLAEPLKDEAKTLVWEHWTEPLRVKCGRGLSDYRVMSAVVLVTFVVLYLIFR